MTDTIDVHLKLAADTPDSMTFAEVYEGLDQIWYRFSADSKGNVELWATRDGFEWLARYFLKLSRSEKIPGFHDHLTLEFSSGPSLSEPELTIGVVNAPLPADNER
jgi:hypothetical protein